MEFKSFKKNPVLSKQSLNEIYGGANPIDGLETGRPIRPGFDLRPKGKPTDFGGFGG